MDRNTMEQRPPGASEPEASRLLLKLGVTTVCRIALNTARRFPYPFALTISRGLGVPLTVITTTIALSQAIGVSGFIIGPMTDRIGYRFMMLAGLLMMIVGMLLGGIFPYYSAVCAAFFLAGLGKYVFDPALQAYVGAQIPFNRRGRIIGILETSWAGSTLLGIPLIGLLIHHFGWRSPFFFLAALGIMGAVALRYVIPPAAPKTKDRKAPSPWRSWRKLFGKRASLGALAFGFLISAANDNLFVVYGVWLDHSYGLTVAAIGAGTIIIGIAELAGESITAFFGDRMGLKKGVCVGLVLSAAGYASLGLFNHHLGAALGALFFIFLFFEFTIVTFLSLCTELLPAARATMMAGFLAAAGMGRMVGALMGVPIWQNGGVAATGMVSAGINLLALIVFLWGLKGWRQDVPVSTPEHETS
jgi:DHA1 family inner membrane transport protein